MDDRNILVCRCEEVKLGEILEILDFGATNINEVRKLTRAGMGLCQGKTCTRTVRQIMAQYLGKDISEICMPRVRPPVRPIPICCFEQSSKCKITNEK